MDRHKKIFLKHRLKNTPQRAAIYRVLLSNRNHPTAETVFRTVRKEFPSISFDTVNRTLIRFAQIGLIHPVECSGQGKKYDTDLTPHHHVKCVDCGAIHDFRHAAFDALPLPEKIRKRFTIITQKVVLTGLCRDCEQKGGISHGNTRKTDSGRTGNQDSRTA
jgi:Fur family peroxide stress response transcriptional regulator